MGKFRITNYSISAIALIIILFGWSTSIESNAVAYEPTSWKDLVDASKEVQGDDTIDLEAEAIGKIKKNIAIMGNSVVKKIMAGHAWLDLDDDDGDGKINGFLTSIHFPLGLNTETQDPKKIHLHVIEARPSPNTSRPWDFCLNFNDLSENTGEITIEKKKKRTVFVNTPLEDTGVDPDSLDTASSYTIWDPEINNGPCNDDEVLVRLNGIVRGTSVSITS